MENAEDLITLDDGISNDILKCYDATVKLGFDTFGILQNSNGDIMCRTSESAANTYNKFGKATDCQDNGTGADKKAQIYRIISKLKQIVTIISVFYLPNRGAICYIIF